MGYPGVPQKPAGNDFRAADDQDEGEGAGRHEANVLALHDLRRKLDAQQGGREQEGDEELEEDEDEDEDDEEEDDDEVARKDSFENSRFQSRPGRKQAGWFTPRWCAEITGNPTEARVLGQIAHWFGVSERTGRCRAKIERDGYYWIYKHYPQLAKETRLTEKQVGDAMRNFIARGIVVAVDDDQHGRLLRLDPIRVEEILLSVDGGDDQ